MQPYYEKDGTTRFRGSATEKATICKTFGMVMHVAVNTPPGNPSHGWHLRLAWKLNEFHKRLSVSGSEEIPAYDGWRETIGDNHAKLAQEAMNLSGGGQQVEQAPGLKTTVAPEKKQPFLPEKQTTLTSAE